MPTRADREASACRLCAVVATLATRDDHEYALVDWMAASFIAVGADPVQGRVSGS